MTLLSFLWYDKLWGPSQRVVTLFLVNAAVGLILISSVSEVCMEMKVEVLTQLHMKY